MRSIEIRSNVKRRCAWLLVVALLSTGVHAFPSGLVVSADSPDHSEADRLFDALSAGGKVEMIMQVMFWGDYFGSFSDRFGIHWMINCAENA